MTDPMDREARLKETELRFPVELDGKLFQDFTEDEFCRVHDFRNKAFGDVKFLIRELKASLAREKIAAEALTAAKIFMNEAWDGKINSWKFRPGWDEANNKIVQALTEIERV